MPELRVYVDNETCIGCGACVVTCPDNFVLEGDKAKAIKEEISDAELQCNKDAKESCPVEAIRIEEIKEDAKEE